MKIAVIGAPNSGKSTLAARIYAELLEQGCSGAYLVHEEAKAWLGAGKTIDTFFDQREISEKQFEREQYAVKCGFTHLVCDSHGILGQVILNWRLQKFGKHEDEKDIPNFDREILKYTNWVNSQKYDMTIYVPLFSKEDGVNQFRIHDHAQSEEIDRLIRINLEYIDNVEKAPKQLKNRKHFIKCIAEKILE